MHYQILIMKMEEHEDEMPTIDIPGDIIDGAIGVEICAIKGKPCIRCLVPRHIADFYKEGIK